MKNLSNLVAAYSFVIVLVAVLIGACTQQQLKTANDYVDRACELIVGERVDALEKQGFGPAELLKAAELAREACRLKMLTAGSEAATGALPEDKQ